MSRSPIVHCHFMQHFYERINDDDDDDDDDDDEAVKSVISQGSAATGLRGGGNFNYVFFSRSFLNLTVKNMKIGPILAKLSRKQKWNVFLIHGVRTPTGSVGSDNCSTPESGSWYSNPTQSFHFHGHPSLFNIQCRKIPSPLNPSHRSLKVIESGTIR